MGRPSFLLLCPHPWEVAQLSASSCFTDKELEVRRNEGPWVQGLQPGRGGVDR